MRALQARFQRASSQRTRRFCVGEAQKNILAGLTRADMTNARNCILLVEDNREDAAIAVNALPDHARSHETIVLNDGAQARDFLNAVGGFARTIRDVSRYWLTVNLLPPKPPPEPARGQRDVL